MASTLKEGCQVLMPPLRVAVQANEVLILQEARHLLDIQVDFPILRARL
jgi:hypothetical protein